jgi:hypothetical protein
MPMTTTATTITIRKHAALKSIEHRSMLLGALETQDLKILGVNFYVLSA